jgi:hypothetical protein
MATYTTQRNLTLLIKMTDFLLALTLFKDYIALAFSVVVLLESKGH